MKIAITGGAGFIGSHLTKAYLEASSIVLDNTRARHILAWHPEVNLSVGIW